MLSVFLYWQHVSLLLLTSEKLYHVKQTTFPKQVIVSDGLLEGCTERIFLNITFIIEFIG